ncbi:MAG: hypothetical protein PHI18_06285 [bacterium]|nr:hypothetical protein [bacterium]
MNNIAPDPSPFFDVLLIIVGGMLATGGGVLTELVKLRMEDNRRKKVFCTLISDEVRNVVNNVGLILEIFNTRSEMMIVHIERFRELWESHERLRGELYLIRDDSLRQEITTFYSTLKTTAKESQELLGKIPNTDTEKEEHRRDQDRKIASLRELKSSGEGILRKLKP